MSIPKGKAKQYIALVRSISCPSVSLEHSTHKKTDKYKDHLNKGYLCSDNCHIHEWLMLLSERGSEDALLIHYITLSTYKRKERLGCHWLLQWENISWRQRGLIAQTRQAVHPPPPPPPPPPLFLQLQDHLSHDSVAGQRKTIFRIQSLYM